MSQGRGTTLSADQERIVTDRRPRILVSAGAGSGKTRLLVAYFVRALIDEGVPVDRLVAVTFTRKAAAELADRIRRELRERGRSDLAWSLDAATIGTIHSLCRRLIKEQALEAGIDPAWSVLEAEAATLLKEQVSGEVWERVVEDADDTELGVLASGRDALRRQIAPLYDRLRGLGNEVPQVSIPSGPSLESARVRLVDAGGRALAAAAGIARPGVALAADLDRLRACLDWVEGPLPDDQRAARLEETEGFFPSKKTASMEEHFEPVREALRQYRLALAEIRLRPLVSAVNHLLAEFHQRYELRKRERGVVDFADLELLARRLARTAVAGGGRGPLLPESWVLIDEFQDTNELQCSILDGLGAARLLMVGDRRQSIYRFRGADVDVFRKREEELGGRPEDDPVGALHRLDTNYRSRPEILDFVNRLFAHPSHFGEGFKPLLRPEAKEVEQGSTQGPAHGLHDTARAGRETVPPLGSAYTPQPDSAQTSQGDGPARSSCARAPSGAAVEVLVAERGTAVDSGKPLYSIPEAEARVVAGRIQAFVAGEGYAQRDIAVLLPANTYVDVYRQVLLAGGLDVYVVRGKGYYSQEEVADILSLLRLLVNPHDDLAMVAALRSPLVGVSDDALYHLGRERAGSKGSIWDVVRSGRVAVLGDDDRSLLDVFFGRLDELRGRVGRPGLSRLIDDAVSLCAYDLCVLGSPDGLRRFANVRKLMRMARDYEALEGPDLAGFVELVGSMGDLSDQEGSAPTLAERDDVVRVMTIHQAKGLEFPVVVLAGLGSDVFHGQRPDIVVGDDGRVGVFLRGSKRASYESDDLCAGPAAEIVAHDQARGNEEDIRLLYVAMTRAQERLILVGARPTAERMDRSRVGRILIGLGLQELPPEGARLPLEDLDALLASVSASEQEGPYQPPGPRTSAAAPRRGGEGDQTEAPPVLLESVKQGGGPRHLSFSALAAYQRCPRRFYLERVLGLDLEAAIGGGIDGGAYRAGPGDGESADEAVGRGDLLLDPDERRGGREVGLLVHGLLERLPVVEGGPSEELVRVEAGTWLRLHGIPLPPADVDRAVTLTLAFWQSEPARVWSHPAAEREAPFFFAREKVLMSGIMDLILRDDHGWRIVDYKTNALNGRAPAELARDYDLQAAVYCLAALSAGAPAVQMDFVFLERPDQPQTTRYGREDIVGLAGILDGVLGRLRRGEFPAEANGACTRCPVEAVCAGMVHE